MNIYVVVAMDEDNRLRECYALTDLSQAQEVYGHLRNLYGGRNAALASRIVDAPPINLYDNCIIGIEQEM